MHLNKEESRQLYKRIKSELRFMPSTDSVFPPFKLQKPYVIYDISQTYDTDFIDILPETVTQAFIRSTQPGEKLYAIDWFHSYFLYDPRNPDDGQSVYVEDATHPDGGYRAYFPGFYPDGDYFFFIDQHFRFGYLAHPWREEVWIFGQPLIAEFEQIYPQLGWIKKQDFS